MTNNDENTSRQAETLWQSDDWADLRWRNRDYNALDELAEMTHDADLSSLSEDDLENLAASELPELRQTVIRYKDTRDYYRCSSNQANSARTPSTCAAGTRRTAVWRRACCRRPRIVC